jgi:DNA-binding CsgD family transcriptional regulator
MKQLTDKQKRVLQLLSDGKTQKEIAGDFDVSHRQVVRWVRTLRIIFHALNNEQLIKYATKRELIN